MKLARAQSVLSLCLFAQVVCAGDFARTLYAYPGRTPVLDGVLSPGEWDDALQFAGVSRWVPQFAQPTKEGDLSVRVYVKHDNERLYFAFDVVDDVLYGIDTSRWLPGGHPHADDLTPGGSPAFGDSVELMINASNHWTGDELAAGDGSSWRLLCNLTKSRKYGIGRGGLLEGEPLSNPRAWDTYQHWILSGAQQAVAKPKPGGHGYIIEWAIRFNPCLEVAPGRFYSPAIGDRPMGLNIVVRDVDEKSTADSGNSKHEEWLAGEKNAEAHLRNWATLWMMSKPAHEQRPIKILRD